MVQVAASEAKVGTPEREAEVQLAALTEAEVAASKVEVATTEQHAAPLIAIQNMLLVASDEGEADRDTKLLKLFFIRAMLTLLPHWGCNPDTSHHVKS